jgi:hypothetical protein
MADWNDHGKGPASCIPDEAVARSMGSRFTEGSVRRGEVQLLDRLFLEVTPMRFATSWPLISMFRSCCRPTMPVMALTTAAA